MTSFIAPICLAFIATCQGDCSIFANSSHQREQFWYKESFFEKGFEKSKHLSILNLSSGALQGIKCQNMNENTDWVTSTVMCYWPISIHNWVCIFPSVEFSFYVLAFYTLKCVRRKPFVYCLLFSKTLLSIVPSKDCLYKETL